MPNPLVLFDIDGTLCDTFNVDDECFCAVATEILGVPVAASSWVRAPDVTDSGIVDWLWREHRGHAPSARQIEEFAVTFEKAVARAVDHTPKRFQATRGAKRLLDSLEDVGWDVGIATGAWGRIAKLKLVAAGLPVELLLASADDSRQRLEIFSVASQRAKSARVGERGRTVLVGDGVWDVRVACRLDWPFVGVGRGHRAKRLRECGVTALVENFEDVPAFIEIASAATVPPMPRP